jgi:signal transduction histidine kinase
VALRRLGMVGRIALVLVAAVALEFAGNVALLRWQERELVPEAQVARIAARLTLAERTALVSHPKHRARRLHALAGDGATLNWVPRSVITDYSGSFERLSTLRARLVHAAPALAGRELRLTLMPSAKAGERDLLGAIQLADGSYVTFRVSRYLGAPPAAGTVMALHSLLIAAVLGFALAMVHALVRPLRNLAAAADATGQGQRGAIVAEGPPEVRRVATAFAAMQARLLGAMADQTHALVAVSHDLRTPIQRLRLRAALLPDGDARDAIHEDLAEMEHFIESTLAYVRSGEEEAPRLVDVAAIVATAADDAADLGAMIDWRGPDALPAAVRPLAIKRILANLIDNARRHAARIVVTLAAAPGHRFVLTVEDDGPGIPPDRRAEALLPFRRLDDARGRCAGGAGLGLAIAAKAVEAMGGALTLSDSTLGGLAVRVELPTGRGSCQLGQVHDFKRKSGPV